MEIYIIVYFFIVFLSSDFAESHGPQMVTHQHGSCDMDTKDG